MSNTTTRLTIEQQNAVRYWPYTAHIPIIPCTSINKGVNHKDWNKIDFKTVDFNAELAKGTYDNGIALVLGKTLPNNEGYEYSLALDFDGWNAVEEWFGTWDRVVELSKKTRIEWHQDKGRIHVIFLSKNRPIANRKMNIKSSSMLEVRCEKLLLFASPNVHPDGNIWTELGTCEIAILDEHQLLKLESKINTLCEGYMSDDNKQEYIRWLEDPNTKIREGEGRHEAIKILGCSYFYRYVNGWKDLTDDERKQRLQDWNQQHCIPPLPEKEFNSIWKWITDTHRRQRDKQWEEWENERRKTVVEEISKDPNDNPDFGDIINEDLKGSVIYVTKLKPLTFVVAYNKLKTLIEASIKSYDKTEFDTNGQQDSVKVKYLNQKKLYLTCIPKSITKHKNPLSFLDAATKYTITFVDSVGNHFTFKYKTLSEIISGLRDNGYVQSDGAEGALGVMILAFTKNKTLEENFDMEYTGFFSSFSSSSDEDDSGKKIKIIASNVEIKEQGIPKEDLRQALKVIEEAAKYYHGRLDLLATLITWGMVAPVSYVFKSNINYLKWLHKWGSPNATKSSGGIIVLAMDGHHKDSKYIRNISNIDTIARLGEEIGKTTFPKLVDEVDLNEQNLKYLVNLLKSAISSKILRSKFRPNGSSAIDIPALSPLILTSNAPPPLWDSAYMKRVIDRYFDKSETRMTGDPQVEAFDEFLRNGLDKFYHLGDFRNWFVMNNQDIVLDEKITPLELGKKMLTAAYEYASATRPEWLDKLLPERQLESSLVDNKVAIKNAFETLINVNLKNFNRYDIFEQSDITAAVSNRVTNLLNGKKLPYMKRDKNQEKVIINTGILPELYKYGVTRDQLPNLKALADDLNAEYSRDENGVVIKTTMQQIEQYFDAAVC